MKILVTGSNGYIGKHLCKMLHGKYELHGIDLDDESHTGYLSKYFPINIDEKFVGERGRINCSLRDPSGLWRWLGIQFVISEK